jgi:hypothetical protein
MLASSGCVRAGFLAITGDSGSGKDGSTNDSDAAVKPYAGPGFLAAHVSEVTLSSGGPELVPGSTVQFTPGSADEAWLVLMSGRIQSTGTFNRSVTVTYRINGVERGIGEMENEVAGHALPWLQVDAVSGTTTPQKIEVYIGRTGGTATLQQLRVIAFPLPPPRTSRSASTPGRTSSTTRAGRPCAICPSPRAPRATTSCSPSPRSTRPRTRRASGCGSWMKAAAPGPMAACSTTTGSTSCPA